MSATLRELADEFSCRLYGDPDRIVTRVGTLSGAGPDSVSFLANPLYRAQLASTRAGAVILAERDRDGCPTACLVHERPYAAYARIAARLHPRRTVCRRRPSERGHRGVGAGWRRPRRSARTP